MDCVYSFALAWMVADPQLGGVGNRPLLRYRRRHAIHFVDVKVCEGPKELKNKELLSCLGRYSSSRPSSFSTLKIDDGFYGCGTPIHFDGLGMESYPT